MCGMNVSLLGQRVSPASQTAATLGGKPATSLPANHGTHGGHAEGVGWTGHVASKGTLSRTMSTTCDSKGSTCCMYACGHAESG